MHVDLSDRVKESEQYRLILEILPSGNRLRYSYDLNGHLSRVEMCNASEKKVLSWINLEHQVGKKRVVITTSDQRQITYHLSESLITQVHYSDQPEQSYTYDGNGKLTQKLLPGKPLQVEYDAKGRVACLKESLGISDQLYPLRLFSYGDGFTEVQNALGHKTLYRYSKKEQLEAIERYDALGVKYRVDRRFWEIKREQCCLLVAKTIKDGSGNTISCRRFSYDDYANVIEESLYGNLTEKNDAFLKMGKNGRVIGEEDDDCHVKKVEYSRDGFNLITKLGDCKGNETVFEYFPGTNRLVKKLVKDNRKKKVQKRFFYSHNDDAVLIQTVEDDGSQEDPNKIYGWGVSKRHITSIKPKEEFPGVGLALEALEQAAEYKDQFTPYQVKRVVNAYDTQGRVIKEDCYDADNVYRYSKTWDYDAHGNLIKGIDQEGREILYVYDTLDNCVLKQIPSRNMTSEFSYDKQGRITEVRETYGSTQQILTNSYDLLGRKISSTDRKGNQTDFEYDSRGFLEKVTHPLMKDNKGQITRPTVSYENDIFGNPLKTIDAKGHVMLKRFNLRGSPLSIDYPDGTYELFKYDPEGSLHRHMTRDKIISIFEYDFLGRQVNEERSTAGKNGSGSWIDNTFCKYSIYHLESVKDKGAIVCYEYDAVGRLSKIYRPAKSYEEDDPESRKEEYTYDLLGRLSQKKIFYDKGDKDYFIEHLEYDIADRVIEKKIEDAQGVSLQASRFIYDSRGLLVEEQALLDGEYKARVKTAYNNLGEPTSIIDALGKETRFLYEDVSDDTGQTVLKKTIIDPSGVSTVMVFDASQRMTFLTKLAPHGEVLSQQNIAYDLAGNKALEENLVISESSQNIQRTAWIFGPMNRIDEMREAVETEKERVTRYVYGEDGKLSEKLLPGMTYTYSKEGKLYKVYYREGDDEDLQISNRYSYDRRGNVTSAYSLGGKSVSRDYNTFDEVTRETIKDEGSEYSVHYEYDRLGRITLIRLPDGSKIQYSYDALHGRSVSRISPSGGLLYTHEYQDYDEWGRLKEEKMLGFLGLRKKEWNLGNQQISLECDYYKERVPQNGYDALGNLLQLHREGSFEPSDLSYIYNNLSQVSSEKGDAQQTYSYDSIGNRLNKNKEQYTYNSLNQLLKTPEDHYEYDSRGCLTKRSRNGVEWEFESNVLGQLIRIQKHDKTALDFSYGPFGRRLTKNTLMLAESIKRNFLFLVTSILENRKSVLLKKTEKFQSFVFLD